MQPQNPRSRSGASSRLDWLDNLSKTDTIIPMEIEFVSREENWTRVGRPRKEPDPDLVELASRIYESGQVARIPIEPDDLGTVGQFRADLRRAAQAIDKRAYLQCRGLVLLIRIDDLPESSND